jgi:hypothetical protein
VDHYASAHLDADPLNSAPFQAYQMMTGSQYVFLAPLAYGDPLMLLSAPAGQYLDRYVFNTDHYYDFLFDHIVVVRPAGALVIVECLGMLPDADFVPLGSTIWEVGRFYLDYLGDVGSCTDGVQVLHANQSVGLAVIGYTHNGSYGYLGGVGVFRINPIIE